MSAEFKLQNAIDSSIIQTLQAINKELSSTKTRLDEAANTYAKLAQQLACGLGVKPNDIASLEQKYAEYNKTLAALHDKQNELSKLQAEYNAKLKEAQTTTKEAIQQAINEEKVKQQQLKTEQQRQKVLEQQVKTEQTLNRTKKQMNITTQEAVELARKEVHSINEATEANRLLRIAVKQITDEEDKDRKIRNELNAQIQLNTEYIRRNSDAYTQQKMNVGNYTESIKKAYYEIKNGNVSLREGFGIIASNTGKLASASLGFDKLGSSIGGMIKGFVGAQAIMGAVSQLFSALKAGVNTAISFQAENSKLAAILGTTTDKTKSLQLAARELGATTKYTASEATALQIELAKLGFAQEEIQQSTKYVMRFAQATGVELAEAAQLAGSALRMFGAETTETERYVSAMAIATTKSALSFSYLQTALPIAGSVAKTFGFEIEDVLSLLGRLANAGVDASSAATATRNILLNLANGGGKLSKALGGSVNTIDEFAAGLKKVNDNGMELAEMLDITDKRSVNAFSNFVKGSDEILKLRNSITDVSGNLEDMSKTMGSNTAGAIKTLNSAWDELMLSIYGSTGAVKTFIDAVTTGVRWITELIKTRDQLLGEGTNKAMTEGAKYSKESLKSEMIAVNQLKEQYIKSGMDENEALEKAKQERIAILRTQYEQYNKLAQEANEKYNDLYKQKDEWGLFSTYVFGDHKSISEIENEINEALAVYTDNLKKAASLEQQIKGIEVITNKDDSNEKQKKYISDKELRELEKQRKEQLRIDKSYEDSKIALMDEGLQKELASIRNNYMQKIAQIKGNSKEEKETRMYLAEAMQREIDKKEMEYILNAEKNTLALKLSAVEKGSEEEKNIRLRQLDVLMKEEINAITDNYADMDLIIAKYDKERADIEDKFAEERMKKKQQAYALQAIYDKGALDAELSELEKQLMKKEITEEEYQIKSATLNYEYQRKKVEDSLSMAREELNNLQGDESRKQELLKEIAEQEMELARIVSDYEISQAERTVEAHKKKMQELTQLLSQVSSTIGAIGNFGDQIFENKISKIEEEQEANDKAYDKEIEHIESLAEHGAISEEEAEARKRAAEDETARKNEEIEKKKAALARKQAIFDKSVSFAQTSINIAQAIMKAWSQGGIFATPMVALISAMGALQLATIAATPIPKYAKGTDYHKGGLAIVGDGGKQEGIITPSGETFTTPSTPTLVSLPKGSKVVPDIDKLMQTTSDISFMISGKPNDNKPVIVNNDYTELSRDIRHLEKSQLESMKKQEKMIKRMNYRMFAQSI